MAKQKVETKRRTKGAARSDRPERRAAPARAAAPRPGGKQPPAEPPKSSNTKYVWAIVLFFLSIYLGICTLSYFFTWKDDQNVAEWQSLFVGDMLSVQNWGGRLGAVLSNMFVYKWFGVLGFCIPVLVFLSAFLVAGIRRLHPLKRFFSVFFLMIIGSVSAAYLFSHEPEAFGGGWGGNYGRFLNDWLETVLGGMGAGVILAMFFLIWGVYSFSNTISLIGKSMRLAWAAGVSCCRLPARLPRPKLTPKAPRPAVAGAGAPVPEDSPAGAVSEPEILDTIDNHYDEEIDEGRRIPLEPLGAMHAAADTLSGGDPLEVQGRRDFETAGTIIGFNTGPVTAADDEEYVLFEVPEETGALPEEAEEPEPYDGHVGSDGAVDNSGLMEQDELPHEVPLPVFSEEPAVPAGTPLISTEDFEVEQTPREETLADEQIDDSLYDPTLELSRYRRPPVDLLEDHSRSVKVTEEELIENKNRIVETLENFNIRIDKIKATIGPTVTLYEIIPAPGVRISKIKNLEDDIALSLSALGIRIIAPIPGKGTIGIEVPNKDKEVVSMYSAIKSAKFQESSYDLPVVLGRTIQNENYVIDLAKMPHLLVAGATGQGKSVGLNAIITSLLYKKHPSELKFILVDPKKVELTLYSRLEKHFLAKMPQEEEAIITDTQKVIYTLNSLCIEMDSRYDLLKKAKVRNIKEYNGKFLKRKLSPENGHRFLPYFVVIIDEFADLIMTAGREIETPIARIAQLARAVGIHLVIATQRPTTNIITGVIKANFPARIAFRVTSMIDSRTILDHPGANQLIGRGDMLVSTGSEVTRVQCAFIDTPEVERITEFIGEQRGYVSAYELPEYVPESEKVEIAGGDEAVSRRDGLFEEVARYVVTHQQGSASTIQRKFSIGFNRAGRLMDQLEAAGIVGRQEGSKPRQVLVGDLASLEVMLYDMDRQA